METIIITTSEPFILFKNTDYFSSVSMGGTEARPPLPLLKLVKKRWPSPWATSVTSHRAPLGQISGSATVFESSFKQYSTFNCETRLNQKALLYFSPRGQYLLIHLVLIHVFPREIQSCAAKFKI